MQHLEYSYTKKLFFVFISTLAGCSAFYLPILHPRLSDTLEDTEVAKHEIKELLLVNPY